MAASPRQTAATARNKKINAPMETTRPRLGNRKFVGPLTIRHTARAIPINAEKIPQIRKNTYSPRILGILPLAAAEIPNTDDDRLEKLWN